MHNQIIKFFNLTGLTWFVPIVKIAAGDNPAIQVRQLFLIMGVPLIAFAFFLGFWSFSAAKVNTSLGTIPGPADVLHEAQGLVEEHHVEKQKQIDYYHRQEERIAKARAEDPNAEIKIRPYNGKPTYLDQICTSLYTVFTGFILATLVAVPLGLLCGMSPVINTALNPLIQIFKPAPRRRRWTACLHPTGCNRISWTRPI